MKLKLVSRGFLRAALSTVTVFGVSVSGFFAVPAQASAPPDGEYSCETGTTDGPPPTYRITEGEVTTGSGSDCVGAVVIPAGVEEIGNSAFEVGLLQSISIPNSVISIGASAFDTSSLESISFEPGSALETIGSYAFLFSSIETIDLSNGNSLVTIGEGAFQGVTTLTSISIPNSVTSIGDSAFRSTTSLTSISIPNSVTTIGDLAFQESGLTSIVIPNSITSIGTSAFRSTTSLTSISIPNSVTSIGFNAFHSTTSLTSVSIPNSVTYIGTGAFQGSGLTSIVIPNSVTYIGYRAFYGSGLTSIVIPNSITSIEPATFGQAEDLSSVTIPTSVTSIGSEAFGGTISLRSVTIPASVTSIGAEAFANSENLSSVYFLGDAPTVQEYADTFLNLPVSARAIIQPSATGFGSLGDIWNGLNVRYNPTSLYRDWEESLPTISNGPIVGQAVYATAFERVLSRNLLKPDGVDGPYSSDVETYPTPEEYVYRITRVPNDKTTSVDHQSDDGYEMLSATEQQDWYSEISPTTPYLFSWKAFMCVENRTLSIPTDLSLSYASREDAIRPNFGFDSAQNLMFQDAANDWIWNKSPSTRTLVGPKISVGGVYTEALRGDPDSIGFWSKVFGILDVSSSCGGGKTLQALPILDSNDEAITTKSFVIPSQLRLDVPGENMSVSPIGVTIGVTGGGFAPEFHAALWGLTTIADPNAPPTPTPTTSGAVTAPPAAPAKVLAATGEDLSWLLFSGFTVTFAGSFLLAASRRKRFS